MPLVLFQAEQSPFLPRIISG